MLPDCRLLCQTLALISCEVEQGEEWLTSVHPKAAPDSSDRSSSTTEHPEDSVGNAASPQLSLQAVPRDI